MDKKKKPLENQGKHREKKYLDGMTGDTGKEWQLM